MKYRYFLAIASLFLPLFQAYSQDEYQINDYVFGNGGGLLENEDYNAEYTIGQPLIGILENDDNISEIGFWYVEEYATTVEHDYGEIVSGGRIIAYPNPFKNTLYLNIDNIEDISGIRVEFSDVFGNITEAASVELSSKGGLIVHVKGLGKLAEGAYFYRIYAGGKVFSGKALKIR